MRRSSVTRAASTWAGIAAVFGLWVVATAASMDARSGAAQEGGARLAPLVLAAGRTGAPQPPASPAPPTPPGSETAGDAARGAKSTAGQAAGYAGTDVCLECHEAQGAIAKTPHGRASHPRTPAAAYGCESCHGPGQAHVDDDDKGRILRFGDTKAEARPANEACLSCHTKGPHALWDGSAHDARNMSCSSCHSVHAPASPENQLTVATQAELCATCHRQQAAKMRRSSHMPIVEGKMECSSCHDPHGATNVKLLRVGNWLNETCISCHTEKRGPFLHEHAAVRDNCSSCHDPHGSPHPRMLIAKPPMLCQRCHNHSRHPATIYDQLQLNARSNRMLSRGCVNCHSAIHGSNHPAGLTLLR